MNHHNDPYGADNAHSCYCEHGAPFPHCDTCEDEGKLYDTVKTAEDYYYENHPEV